MTTGKINRNAVVSQLNRADKTPAVGSTPLALEVAEVAKVADKPLEPVTGFGERSKHLEPKSGEGTAVSTTASEHDLWASSFGLEGKNPPLYASTLRGLNRGEIRAKRAELSAKKDDIKTKIDDRATQLDRRWENADLTTKTTALKEYLAATPNVPPEIRTELEAAINLADTSQAKIHQIIDDVHALKRNPETGKNGTPEQRRAAVVKLLEMRATRHDMLETATAAIDAAGLKIELLALTESTMDPKGAETSSLLGLVTDYFKLSFMMNVLDVLDNAFDSLEAQEKKARDAEKKRLIEEEWQGRDVLLRTLLKGVKIKSAKAPPVSGATAATKARAL